MDDDMTKATETEQITGTAVLEAYDIKRMIFVVRGYQVMLDSDLAMLYQVDTGRINESAKRNSTRFPENFRFQLSEQEFLTLTSQIAISKTENTRGGRRKMPYVYTEQGIAMLSAVLHSNTAIQVSVNIMNAFVEMRRFIASNASMFQRITDVELKQLEYQKQTDEKFDQVFSYIQDHEESSQKVFFDGQIYDAYSLLAEIIGKAEKSIVLIDNYVGLETLDLIAKKRQSVSAEVYTSKKARVTETDIAHFNAQYPVLTVHYTDAFHDRFLILDKTEAYHIGASLKDAGKKCFGISLIQDAEITASLLSRVMA